MKAQGGGAEEEERSVRAADSRRCIIRRHVIGQRALVPLMEAHGAVLSCLANFFVPAAEELAAEIISPFYARRHAARSALPDIHFVIYMIRKVEITRRMAPLSRGRRARKTGTRPRFSLARFRSLRFSLILLILSVPRVFLRKREANFRILQFSVNAKYIGILY